MKQLFRLYLLLALLLPNVALAYDIEVDGIYYDIIDNEAIVTYKNYSSYTFYYSDYSGDVTIPASITFGNKTYPVTRISEYAFYECAGLTSVHIPNSVTYIGYEAFYGCTGLIDVNIPNSVTLINSYLFYGCTGLTSISIPNSITEIDYCAFYGCSGLTNIEIPNTVTYIGDWAFYECSGLASINIPASVTSIGNLVFAGCTGLTSITVDSNNPVFDSRDNCNAIIEEYTDYDSNYHVYLLVGCQNTVIPNSVTDIGYGAFRECSTLKRIIIPNSVAYIGSEAFNGCDGLTSINVPDYVTNIGQSAFLNCSSLNSVSIPASVTEIGDYAFAGCSGLKKITVESSNPVFDSRNNCNAIIKTASNTLLAGCQNTLIPSSATSIGDYAFFNCSTLKSITIPKSIKTIGDRVFAGCSGLKNLYTKIAYFSDFSYGAGIFEEVPMASCVLHVPNGTSSIYQSMAQWREFSNIEEMTKNTDTNGDDEVNIADVNYIISLILSDGYDARADANEDGEINIADVNEVIYHILNGDEDQFTQYGYHCLAGIYRSMHTAGWSTTGNTHQCFGISAYNLMAEVMGDDFIMGAQGSGWFWFDAAYSVKSRYTSSAWRSYDLWNAYYTWIANANEILSFKDKMTSSNANYIIGQAFAIRAYSYFMLAQTFARTYAGHTNDPCVPLFSGTGFAGTGQPRATVAQVYAQIDDDISKAVMLLMDTQQQRPEHMGLAVALGLKARIALVKEDWNTALNSAEAAISASGRQILDVPSFIGLNDASAQNVMWGAKITAQDVGMYASLFAHLSTDIVYGQRAPKQISPALYQKMNSSDARRAWWNPNDPDYSFGGYIQRKFDFSNLETWEGDYIWMRIEEMYLTAAEAACRLGIETTAKNYLMQLMNKRDPYYSCNKSGTRLGALTSDETGSLLEEILLQRRIELWGEDGRIYTIRRLRQGFERTTERGWPDGLLIYGHQWAAGDPESYLWVLTIPQAEFDTNPYLNPDPLPNGDQNPIGDYPY